MRKHFSSPADGAARHQCVLDRRSVDHQRTGSEVFERGGADRHMGTVIAEFDTVTAYSTDGDVVERDIVDP